MRRASPGGSRPPRTAVSPARLGASLAVRWDLTGRDHPTHVAGVAVGHAARRVGLVHLDLERALGGGLGKPAGDRVLVVALAAVGAGRVVGEGGAEGTGRLDREVDEPI